MRILFIVSQIPFPPTNGLRIVSFNAMRLMREAGHDLALAILSDETWDVNNRLEHMHGMCQHLKFIKLTPKSKLILFLRVISGKLYFMERYSNHDFHECLKQTISFFKPDAIHFDTILMTQYHNVAPSGTRKIASINDSYCLSLENGISAGGFNGFQLLYRYLQLFISRKHERNIYPFFDAIHVMSSIDSDYLQNLNPKITTAVIPNGVSEELLDLPLPDFEQQRLVIVANWERGNLYNLKQFLLESWVVVRKQCPNAVLSVVGHFPNQEDSVVRLAEQVGNVLFLGYIEELKEIYSKSCVAIVPIQKNCGIINKALEGMAAAHCVLGLTPAFSGLVQAYDGVHYSSSKDFNTLGIQITQFLSNPLRMKHIGEAARHYIKDNYSWNSKKRLYEALYSGEKTSKSIDKNSVKNFCFK